MKLISRLVFGGLISAVIFSAHAAQEQEQKMERYAADLKEIIAVKRDVGALVERLRRENKEAFDKKIAVSKQASEELIDRLIAEKNSEQEKVEEVNVFCQSFVQEGRALIQSQNTNIINRVKEFLADRAPALLAEDPDLTCFFKKI